MICSTKIIKIRTRVWKKLVKTRNLYGFQSLSETIDYLLGNDKVNKLLKEEEQQDKWTTYYKGN